MKFFIEMLSMSAGGGDADPAVGTGGAGGWIAVISLTPPSIYSGSWLATGGSGSVPGADGLIEVDGTVIFP